MVQHWLDEDADVQENEYEGLICPACTKLHFFNRKTGKLFGQKEEYGAAWALDQRGVGAGLGSNAARTYSRSQPGTW